MERCRMQAGRAWHVAAAVLLFTAACGDSAKSNPTHDAGPSGGDLIIGGDHIGTVDHGGAVDTAPTIGYVGTIQIEQLFNGHPNVTMTYLKAADVTSAPITEKAGCEVS